MAGYVEDACVDRQRRRGKKYDDDDDDYSICVRVCASRVMTLTTCTFLTKDKRKDNKCIRLSSPVFLFLPLVQKERRESQDTDTDPIIPLLRENIEIECSRPRTPPARLPILLRERLRPPPHERIYALQRRHAVPLHRPQRQVRGNVDAPRPKHRRPLVPICILRGGGTVVSLCALSYPSIKKHLQRPTAVLSP